MAAVQAASRSCDPRGRASLGWVAGLMQQRGFLRALAATFTTGLGTLPAHLQQRSAHPRPSGQKERNADAWIDSRPRATALGNLSACYGAWWASSLWGGGAEGEQARAGANMRCSDN